MKKILTKFRKFLGIGSSSKNDEISIDEGEIGVDYDESQSAIDSAYITKIRGRLKSKKRKNRFINSILNKMIVILLLICIILIGTYYIVETNSSGIAKRFSSLSPKKYTTIDVFYQLKSIREIQTLKINRADFYKYSSGNKYADLIIRYSIYVNFDMENMNVIENNDGTFTLKMKKPEVRAILLDGIKYTKDKMENEYPGVEVFDVSNSWIPGTDFKLGQETYRDIADRYIKEQCKLDSAYYTNKAFNNFREKLMEISNELDLNISEIILEGESE